MSRAFALALLALPLDAFAGCLRLNELFPNPTGADAGFEWVEIYNRCDPGNSIDLSNFVLRVGHAGATTDVPLAGTVPGTTRFVVGEPSVQNAGYTVAALNLRNALNDAEYLALVKVSDGSIQDSVVYGAPNTSGWTDDTGAVATSLAPTPAEGESVARVLDYEDVPESGVAWVATADTTPGRENRFSANVCSLTNDDVVINELSSDPAHGEWVELVNTGTVTHDLSHFKILSGEGWFKHEAELPAGTSLAPGEHLVVSSAAMPEADLVDPLLDVPRIGAGQAGVVRLNWCQGGVVDTVLFGDASVNGFAEDDFTVPAALPEAPSAAGSLSRHLDGVDTDSSVADLHVTSVPTPGAKNLHLESQLVPGGLALSVFNAEPGETAYFAGGTTAGNGPCLPQLGGECLGILAPRLLGTDTADAAGTAALTVPVPAQAPAILVYTQGALVRGVQGADSVVTNVEAEQL